MISAFLGFIITAVIIYCYYYHYYSIIMEISNQTGFKKLRKKIRYVRGVFRTLS